MLPIVLLLRRSANALVVLACCLAFSALFPACGGDVPPAPPPPPPILLVIGVDNSQSFLDFNPFDLPVLDSLCASIAESGRGGAVAFQMIGKPTNRSPLMLKIDTIPAPCAGLTPTKKKKREHERGLALQKQKEQTEAFLSKCQQELSRPRDADTDLNGFFRRTEMLAAQPQYDDAEKYLFLYTDGHHDVRSKSGARDIALDCSLLPPAGLMSICASGWKNAEKCDFAHEFTAPSEFAAFFKRAIQKKTSVHKKTSAN